MRQPTARTCRTRGKTHRAALANIKTMGDLLSVIVRYRPFKSVSVRICPLDDIAPCGTPHVRQPTGRTSGNTHHAALANIKTMSDLLSVIVRICPYLSVFVRICPYLSVFVRICPYLSVFVR